MNQLIFNPQIEKLIRALSSINDSVLKPTVENFIDAQKSLIWNSESFYTEKFSDLMANIMKDLIKPSFQLSLVYSLW